MDYMKITSTNPSRNYEVIGEVEASTREDVIDVVKRARQAQQSWAELSIAKRCEIMMSFVAASTRYADELAECTALETGRPLAGAKADVAAGIACFEAYIASAEEALAPKVTKETTSEIHRIYREPWGVIAAICPWNFPFSNVAWQCGQALLAGNAVIYKNSEENPLFAQIIAKIITASDLPDGLFAVVYGDGQVGDWLAHAEGIDKLSFTGSYETGHTIAKIAAERFLPFTGELGGSTPLIVFDDVELTSDEINTIYIRRFSHSGQFCTSLKRLIVHESKFDEIVEMLTAIVSTKKIGDAMDKTTDLGPLVAERQVVTLEGQVQDALQKDAKLVAGGKRPSGLRGAYYMPTILTNVTSDMRVWKEETFGPVLPIVPFKTEEEAIDLANDTEYGLSAHIFTADKARFERVARKLQSGMIAHNQLTYLDAGKNPFGGYKHSGMGRENGEAGFHDVTQIKIVSAEK